LAPAHATGGKHLQRESATVWGRGRCGPEQPSDSSAGTQLQEQRTGLSAQWEQIMPNKEY